MIRDRKGFLRSIAIIGAIVLVWAGLSAVIDSSYYRLLLTIVPILISPLRSVGKMSELELLEPQSSPIASASSAPA